MFITTVRQKFHKLQVLQLQKSNYEMLLKYENTNEILRKCRKLIKVNRNTMNEAYVMKYRICHQG